MDPSGYGAYKSFVKGVVSTLAERLLQVVDIGAATANAIGANLGYDPGFATHSSLGQTQEQRIREGQGVIEASLKGAALPALSLVTMGIAGPLANAAPGLASALNFVAGAAPLVAGEVQFYYDIIQKVLNCEISEAEAVDLLWEHAGGAAANAGQAAAISQASGEGWLGRGGAEPARTEETASSASGHVGEEPTSVPAEPSVELRSTRKCGCSFASDTLIETRDGERAIGSLKPGDYVLAFDQVTGAVGFIRLAAGDGPPRFIDRENSTLPANPSKRLRNTLSSPKTEGGSRRARYTQANAFGAQMAATSAWWRR